MLQMQRLAKQKERKSETANGEQKTTGNELYCIFYAEQHWCKCYQLDSDATHCHCTEIFINEIIIKTEISTQKKLYNQIYDKSWLFNRFTTIWIETDEIFILKTLILKINPLKLFSKPFI